MTRLTPSQAFRKLLRLPGSYERGLMSGAFVSLSSKEGVWVYDPYASPAWERFGSRDATIYILNTLSKRPYTDRRDVRIFREICGYVGSGKEREWYTIPDPDKEITEVNGVKFGGRR